MIKYKYRTYIGLIILKAILLKKIHIGNNNICNQILKKKKYKHFKSNENYEEIKI